jgi:hypothetical protein
MLFASGKKKQAITITGKGLRLKYLILNKEKLKTSPVFFSVVVLCTN